MLENLLRGDESVAATRRKRNEEEGNDKGEERELTFAPHCVTEVTENCRCSLILLSIQEIFSDTP